MSILHVAFYPSDWLAGTRGLTDAETGVYITLIARMYEMAGAIPRDDERLSRLCGSKTKASFVKSLNQLIFEGKIIDRDGELWGDLLEVWYLKSNNRTKRPHIPNAISKEVWKRDGECCVYCGDTQGPFHLDHIYPWSKGGEHSKENLCVACAPCNLSKGDKTLDEWRAIQ